MDHERQELTPQEQIAEMIRNDGNRYVIIGTPEEAQTGRAIAFDTVTRCLIGIDESEEAHFDLIRRMFQAGVKVVPTLPK